MLLARAVWARLHFNPELVLDGLRGALVRRPGAQQGVQLPELTQYFPEMYVDDAFFAKAREETFIVPEGSRVSCLLLCSSDYSTFNIGQLNES